jgi:hypothetical protein
LVLIQVCDYHAGAGKVHRIRRLGGAGQGELDGIYPGLGGIGVDDVSSKPPNTVSLLFSELSSPVLRTAKANADATTTNAMSTMAVSRPVIPLWSVPRFPGDANLFRSISFLPFLRLLPDLLPCEAN